jgi:hypothetical protein
MAEITKPTFAQLWANGGAIVAPSNSKVELGWTAEIPPHQFENWVQNRQDRALAYLFQRGIAEWDATTEYFANKSVVMYGGVMYKAITNTTNNIPSSSPANWVAMIPTDVAKKMSVKSVNLPYTLVADDANKWLLLNGAGNVTVPSGVFVAGEWTIVSCQSGATTIVAGGGAVVRAQYGKNTVLPGAQARASIVAISSTTFETSGDFQYV